mmetsp:Transcript_396/g.545  ORF Transcript_396/g.545 Transcript_396/m.545 type:complete len:261 (-) Transcript_396:61-843(-)|eukprot:CAMPEP_0184541492 /NCGR_PEP_ID=MMETSP0199_2-20130426/1408_1 /TAXON_ID=1112570 /ORGANISM="Thraustochytrium sp., Strain LLF1b" /LENGTH=260 /DNA_ID=CAMNT_0026935219 /DNA_START=110 /DNA_END=892 /DNA_ORIENTATION=+
MSDNNWKVDWKKWDQDKDQQVFTEELAKRITACDWWAPGARVLDFGCGTGRLIKHLVNAGAKNCVAADVEAGMIGVVEEKLNSGELPKDQVLAVQMHAPDGADVAKIEGQFDVLTTTYVLGHVFEENIPNTIANFATKVAPGGHLWIEDFHEFSHQHAHGHGHSHGEGHHHGEDHHHHEGGHHHHGEEHHHGEGHGFQEKVKDPSAHVSSGGHAHTTLSIEILTPMLEKNGFKVVNSDRFAADFKNVSMQVFSLVAERLP